jgi:hypothetical protein
MKILKGIKKKLRKIRIGIKFINKWEYKIEKLLEKWIREKDFFYDDLDWKHQDTINKTVLLLCGVQDFMAEAKRYLKQRSAYLKKEKR